MTFTNDYIFNKALKLEPLLPEEILALYTKVPTGELMLIANELRKIHVPGTGVSWQIDRNINITNICIAGCKFCNFHCKLSENTKSYTTTIDEYCTKIEELLDFNGDQILLQGGLHPKYGLSFYADLFSELKKRYPQVKLHALGPPEIAHIAKIEKKTYRYILEELIASGLESLPGAGAEILSNRVRKIISPAKPDANIWIDVMREAHAMGLASSATMVFGHIETLQERVEHLIKIRDLQEERLSGTPGFLAFICWPMLLKGTALAQRPDVKASTADDYIRTLAISRIALNNIKNIQASWLTVGKDVAQIALHAGANDMGSIMIEENVVSSVGSTNKFDANGIKKAIIEAGFTPWLRNQKYEQRPEKITTTELKPQI